MIYRYNPIVQNRAHINTLKYYTDYKFKPLVVFTDESIISGFGNEACSLSNLTNVINSGKVLYSQEEIDSAYEYFNSLKIQNTFYAMGQHLDQIQSVKERGNKK
jgi:hypothetical protein